MYNITLSYIVIYIDKQINSNREWAYTFKANDICSMLYPLFLLHCSTFNSNPPFQCMFYYKHWDIFYRCVCTIQFVKHAHIHFHSKTPHTVTKMNLIKGSRISGSVNARS